MITTYFRSSSFNAHNNCPHNFYMEYVLGWRGPANRKADMGTILHKIMEVLAIIKKADQDNKQTIKDEIVGKINVKKHNLQKIIDKVYKYYTSVMKHDWEQEHYETINEWVRKALEYNNGMFDPRNLYIIQPEQHFDITIYKEWAEYNFKLPSGEDINGYLSIKGTIDLIAKVNDTTYEVVDWKSGKAMSWNTGEKKTLEKLHSDPQLMIYHYAVHQLYPDIDQVLVTIYYINDGGPFSVVFTKDDLPKTEDMIRRKFEVVKKTNLPRLNKSFFCRKFCYQGTTNFGDDTKITPLIETRDKQTTPKGSTMSKCEQVHYDLQILGMDETTKKYLKEGHTIDKYKAPGEL